jgi:hypothetical protein
MVRKQVYITAEQERHLKRLARETGAAEADLIRRALDVLQGAEYAAGAAELGLGAREVAAARYKAPAEEPTREAVLTAGQLDDSAWQEELAFIEERARSRVGSTVRWNREDSYDKRRLRLPD